MSEDITALDFTRPRARMREVNLTPLIDVVFHLMVFVMLTTSFVVSESMELTLPTGKSASSDATTALRIQLTPQGGIAVEGTPHTLDSLNRLLASRLGNQPDLKIALFTSAGVTVQELVTVMDAVYLTGGHNVQVDRFTPTPAESDTPESPSAR